MRDEEVDGLLAVLRMPPPQPGTPDERLQLLEDIEAIRDLIMRYGYLCDFHRWDELFELYTDDIERTLAGTLAEVVKGKDQLRPLLEAPALPVRAEDGQGENLVSGRGAIPLTPRHLICGEVIRIADDRSEAWAVAQYTLVMTKEQGEWDRGAHEGAYVFHFRPDDGRWKFDRMTVIANSAHNPIFRKYGR